MTGRRLGNWILQSELGRGAAGVVYRAAAFESKSGGPNVAAVKVLNAALTGDPGFAERFPGEMLGLRRLTHPNLARFLEAGVQDGVAYYVSELAPGMDLASFLQSRQHAGEPGLDWPAVVHRIAVQAARALKHAHHRSILHRDLKPANFLFVDDGSLKLTDCGVSKAFHRPPLALPVEPMGTACYVAPEHFTGKPLTRRSDIYALGGVLYTLVCGRPPFLAASTAEYMHKHCYMLPDRPINFVPKLPVEVDDFICSMLMKDPARRPASAATLLDELEHLRGKLERRGERVLLPPLAEDPTGLHVPLSVIERVSDAAGNDAGRRRDRMLRGGALLALFALVVAIIIFTFLRPRPSAQDLMEKAKPFIDSESPDDWDRAREDYLDRIERWHPGELTAELAAARQRIHDRRELRRALANGANLNVASEAERLYRRGLALAQNGDLPAAKALWQALLTAYAANAADRRWVALAKLGVAESQVTGPARPDATGNVQAILEVVQKMRSDGKNEAADEIISALHSLYQDNPGILAMLK